MNSPPLTEINGRLNALTVQRNNALDQVVLLSGQLEILMDELTQARKQIDELKKPPAPETVIPWKSAPPPNDQEIA